MGTLIAILPVLKALSPLITGLLGWLSGWLMPSPLQKSNNNAEAANAAVAQAESTRGNLDNMG